MNGGQLRLTRAEVDGAVVDVDVVDGVVVRIAPTGARVDTALPTLDANGGALLPGLHDHHVHLLALAASLDSVTLDPATVGDAGGMAQALRAADRDLAPGEWIRAVGYHESIAGDLDRADLDALVPDRPVRVQHRTGALWVLNSMALRILGDPPGGATDGRMFRGDQWLRDRIDAVGARRALPLDRVGTLFTSYGVTGVTDLTPSTEVAEFGAIATAVASGDLPLRVTVTGSASLAAIAVPGLQRGVVKIVIDDHELPCLDDVIAQVAMARTAGRCAALHCVTREALLLAMVALREVGAVRGDRIEHGAVIAPELFADLVTLGVTVVTQPSFVRERGDRYLLDVDEIDRPDLWRCASLIDAGVGVAFGSDAPYGSADPWAMVRSASDRRTAGGRVLGAYELLDPAVALDRLLGSPELPAAPRRVHVGMVADVCLLHAPLRDALDAVTRSTTSAPPNPVRTTLISGAPTAPVTR